VTESEALFERNPDFIFRIIVDEAVLVPVHNDIANMESIFTLNSVGAFIWKQLEQPTGFNDLKNALVTEYSASEEIIQADLENFLLEMTSIGAIRKAGL